jgi:hypothetical protein
MGPDCIHSVSEMKYSRGTGQRVFLEAFIHFGEQLLSESLLTLSLFRNLILVTLFIFKGWIMQVSKTNKYNYFDQLNI